jgi:subtilisin family serine protease
MRQLGKVVTAFALLGAVAYGGTGSAGAAPTSRQDYIVVLKPSVAAAVAATDHARLFGGTVRHVYRAALNGYVIRLSESAAARLAASTRVLSVEADSPVDVDAVQSSAPWGLDRIDQAALPLSTTFTYARTGFGVKAYIIDTGIRFNHAQFGGRAISGYDAVDGGTADDCNGHGTHVAGTVGGSTYGVAKAVSLVAVRVLNCSGSGSTSGVIAGIDWVTANHAAGQPAVANMSLGGSASTALDNAVRNSIADGVTYAIAAGNGSFFGWPQNACNYSPARVAEGITVSATDRSDRKTSWANYGSCLDVFAPGVGITSAWHSTSTATSTISGTSMATPHVAGVAAQYLQGHTTASPATVRNALVSGATLNRVLSPGSGSPSRLLFTGSWVG